MTTYSRTDTRTPARLAALAITFLCSNPAHAAALWLTETGGTDMGMAGAGRTALAADAASLGANPASIAQLSGTTVTVAALPLALDLDFHGTGDMPGSAHSSTPVVPGASAYAVRRADRLAYGIGVYSYIGLGLDFGRHWVGSRGVEQAGMQTITIAPALAWRATERLDVGASVAAQYARVDAAIGVSNDSAFYGPPAGLPDGRIRLSGSTWSPTGSVGAQYRAGESVQLGLAWTAATHHDMRMDLRTRDLHPVLPLLLPADGQVTFDTTLPQQVAAGATWQATPAMQWGIDARWQEWSSVGHTRLGMPGQSAGMFPDGMRDTYGVAAGARHALGNGWVVTGGVAYDSSPATHGDTPVYFPVADQLRLSAGLERRSSDRLTWRLALTVVSQGGVRVEPGTHPLPLPGYQPLHGRFDPSHVYLLAVAADFRP